VVHVLDASRAVGVASALLSDTNRDAFVAETRAEYKEVRERRAERRRETKTQTLEQARANKVQVDWSTIVPPVPSFTGVRTYDETHFPLGDLVPRIDWTPFFQTWELAGHYPDILEDERVGPSARSLFNDAQVMLRKIVEERWLKVRAVVGFFPANSDGAEDINIWTEDRSPKSETPLATIHTIRQQMVKPDGRPNSALADFVAPCSTGLTDWMGLFAVTTGLGVDKKEKLFLDDHDDYSAIMLKALADRLAEAFAERLHQRVRTEFWGYAPDEALSNAELIAEKYRGIRPAPGYPACPDHTVKSQMFEVLNCADIAMGLTESLAMTPAASVSGFYMAHPDAAYFNVGKVGEDQLQDWAARTQQDADLVRRSLAALL